MALLYKTVKKWYDKGLYTKEDVASYVVVGLLSPLEYEQITGEEYTIN